MSRTPSGTSPRLVRPAAGSRAQHVAGACAVALLAALSLSARAVPLIAFVAVGAGAGYSLSGSV